jgi:hypothetical protein
LSLPFRRGRDRRLARSTVTMMLQNRVRRQTIDTLRPSAIAQFLGTAPHKCDGLKGLAKRMGDHIWPHCGMKIVELRKR